MVLLQWCQLTPRGPNRDVAAVIFTKPVQVSSLRIFPTGAKPFTLCPGIVASTEPDSFFLDVFFNALPIQTTNTNSHDPQDKRKNVLVPTRLAYAGGQSEFIVDMGPEYATRLIIFQGQFKEVSIAIYGEVVVEHTEVSEYEPKPLPAPAPIPLSSALDLADSVHPTALAEQLLALMPSPAPLPLLIRLMFCLKPEKEDWDNPHFPYVYSNFEKTFGGDDIENEVFDLESLVQAVSKPLKEDVSAESLTEFVGKMRDLLGSDASDDAYYVAKLLTKSACQQSLFPRILLQHIDLVEMFNEETLDETTLLCLAEAASSIEISRYFSEDSSFMESLNDMASSFKTHKTVQKALKKLLGRVHGWQSFEDALENSEGDFVASSLFLRDISTDEFALGCWLECMINQEELANKLAANPIPSEPRPSLPILFQEEPPPVSHQEFIMFVRAFLGISTALAMLAWSDSLGDDPCCERTLHVLVTWQSVNGYREILNHCLLLRQMARRLEWIKNDEDDQRPKKTGILVERLLVGLAKDPQAMLRSDVVTAVLALKPPFCHISTDEMLEMEKLARVAQDGLWSAFEEIAYDSVRPFSLRRLRVLRVSVAVIVDELRHDNGEWHVLESFWNDRSQSLLSRLITILIDISDDINHHFILEIALRMNQPLSESLFRTGSDFLRLIFHLSKLYPLTTRDLKTLTSAIADLYVCSDAAICAFSPSSTTHNAAIILKRLCLDVLSYFSNLSVKADPGVHAATVILPMLLEHASRSGGRDPVHHIFLLYALIDNFLPRSSQCDQSVAFVHWATGVFAPALQHLREFYRLLDLETRLLFFTRLITIENGEIGLGEWLLEEDIKHLMMLVESLTKDHQRPDRQLLVQGQLSAGIQFWQSVLSSPETSDWVIERLASNPDLSASLNSWLSLLLDARLASLPLTRLSRTLAIYHDDLAPDVSFTLLLLLLRRAQQDPIDGALEYIPAMLKTLTSSAIDVEYLRAEIGHLFSAYSERALTLKEDTSERLLDIMEWIAAQEDIRLTTLTGVSVDGFDYLYTTISSLLPSDRQDELLSVRSKLTIDDDQLLPSSMTDLQDSISLPLQSIKNLLSPKTMEPSTPKGTKTPDILGVIISPPTAILRSPAATGLTKTYVNNDFRQLRQTVSTRLNTSRLPSTHVDEFENPSADLLPALDPIAFPGLPVSL